MPRAPLLIPAVAFTAVIVADAHGLAVLACVLAVVLVVLAGCRTSAIVGRSMSTIAAFGLAGLVIARWYGHPPMLIEESRTGRFMGTVISDVRADENGATFAFALADGLVIQARVHDGAIVSGERLVLRGRLVPFDEARNPGEPSRRGIALGEGLAGELLADRVLARVAPDPRDARTWAARLRARLSARLRATVREPEATVIAGALWGERGTLPHDLRDDFQATGTVHVLVTAGLHLGVIAALVAGLLRLARVPRVAASLAAIPCVVAYAWLSGAHLPSQRAAVMVSVALLARAYGARLLSWNALALAALVVAVLWPASVTTVSFALSFSCVGAILLFARPLEHVLAHWSLPERIHEALSLTIATHIGVWPLSAATFGLVAPYAILANAIVVPATGIAMLAGIAALVLADVPVLDRTAATLATWDVGAILHVVAAVAGLPGAHVRVAPPPAAAIVAYDVAAGLAAWTLRRYVFLAIGMLALASVGVLLTTLRLPDGRLTITMLDVGQGDAIVVRTPRGHTILIDTGGRLERGPGTDGRSPAELVGERIVLAYLQRENIHRIDLMVLTHPHGDHVGGCFPVVDQMRVDAIGDSGQTYGGRAYRDCLAAAHVRRVPVILLREGMRYATDDRVTLDALGPREPLLADGPNDVNENSVVLRLTYACPGCARPFHMLFTGDAGAQSEARMLAGGLVLSADILKVGHHGSAYSSTPEFLAAVHARDALISVGRHNHFGHPSPVTIRALRDAGTRVYRTDLDGAITVTVGTGTTVATMLRDARNM